MIYSTPHKFLYVAVPKTATTAIEHHITHSLKPRFWTHVYVPQEGDKHHPHKHSKSVELRKLIPEYDTYFKFGFVRNPFDKFVSWYCYLTQSLNSTVSQKLHKTAYGDDYLSGSFLDFCKFAPEWIFGNSYSFLCNEWGQLDMDFVGKYENFDEDVKLVMDKIDISTEDLKPKNQSNHKHYTQYYNNETKQIVANRFELDIKMFGYEFGE
jgi:chondroitin 4-sulfotransferase 11